MTLKTFIFFNILPFINNLLRPLSLKLTTIRTPNRSFTDFFSHLASLHYQIQTVIDVGVGRGTETLYKGTQGAFYYLIEAVPDTRGHVANIAKKLGGIFFNVAAGKEHGQVEFYLHDDITGSSLLKQLEDDERINGTLITVPMERLDVLLPKEIKRPSLLKVDTQGLEIDVIKGAHGLLNSIDIVILEASFHKFRQGAPEIADVIGYMNGLGYVPYEILEGHYRSIDNALAQVDLVFVRKDSILRENETFFSAGQVDKYLKSGVV
jgi:FkbM family methyltransferase